MRARPSEEDLLQVLACEFEKRPSAPTIDDIAPLVVAQRRLDGELALEFPLAARETVVAFAAAERQCCAGIDWRVEAEPVVTLRITTNDAALDVLTQMFSSLTNSNSQ